MRCVKNDRLVCDPDAACGPSTFWLGDEFECPICHHRIVTGFGKALASHPGQVTYGEALQFEYEPALMLHLELKAGSGPGDDVTGYMPMRLPAGVGIAEINLGSARRIPLLAFGDVHKPIALLNVNWSGRRVLHAEGRGAGPDHEDSHSLWMPIAEGAVSASLCLRDLRPDHLGWELTAISLELAMARAERPAAEDQQRGGEDDGRG